MPTKPFSSPFDDPSTTGPAPSKFYPTLQSRIQIPVETKLQKSKRAWDSSAEAQPISDLAQSYDNDSIKLKLTTPENLSRRPSTRSNGNVNRRPSTRSNENANRRPSTRSDQSTSRRPSTRSDKPSTDRANYGSDNSLKEESLDPYSNISSQDRESKSIRTPLQQQLSTHSKASNRSSFSDKSRISGKSEKAARSEVSDINRYETLFQ